LINVRILEQDEETLFTKKRISVKNKAFESPIKAINSRNLLDVDIGYKYFISEVYKVLGKKKMSKILADESSMREFNQSIRLELKRSEKFGARLTIFIPALKYMRLNEKELKFIIDTQTFTHFSFYVVPTVVKINKLLKPSGGYKIKDFFTLVKEYLELVESYKIKPVMGMIPITIPYQYLSDLMELYIKRDINAFCIDFGGRVPLNLLQSVSLIQRMLKQNDINAYIHATNVNIGKPSKRSKIIVAKDILSLGIGIDSIGDNHIPMGGEWRSEFGTSNLRLFDREKYGYHRISNVNEIDKILSMNSSIKKKD